MTVQEFIDEYSWELARKWHSEMLAAGSRRPKKWSFVEKEGLEITIYFDGCPFRLKSAKMVDWLRATLLSTEADREESKYGFSAIEQLAICWDSIVTQIEDDLWVFDPDGLPQLLIKAMIKADAYEYGLDLFARLKIMFDEKCFSEDVPETLYWSLCQGSLLSCVYLIEIGLKTDDITENVLEAMNQFNVQLHCCINQAKEENEEPNFSVEEEYFNRITKLIPIIENSGNVELTRMAYEFARDYYQATYRPTLAEKFNAKLNEFADDKNGRNIK